MYALQLQDTKITGNYWELNACLNTTATQGRSCATDLKVFAIEEAEPKFTLFADGFIGLAPTAQKTAATANGDQEIVSSYNMLD